MFRNHATSTHQTYFMLPGSCQMEGIIALYNYIMLYLVGILFFVSAALVIIIHTHLDGSRHNNYFNIESRLDSIKWVRYLKSWTHSTPLELIWTILPTLILIAIAVPSFILLYSLDEIVDTQCVVKVIGYQWYWRYEYPITLSEDLDVTNVYYFSYMKSFSDLTEMWPKRLLEVDMPLILPNNVNIKIIVTAKDVLHSFAVPSLGIKMDAVPGRLNQITLFIFKPGIYYGQCSELCGVNHAFMPIVLHSVSFDIFQNFLNKILLLTKGEEILVNEIDYINPEDEDTSDSTFNDINPTNTNPNDSTSYNADPEDEDPELDRSNKPRTQEDDSDIFFGPVSTNPYLNPDLDIDPSFQAILDYWDKQWNDCMEDVIAKFDFSKDPDTTLEKLRACMKFFYLEGEDTSGEDE